MMRDYSQVAMAAILDAVRRGLDVEGQMRAALAAEHRDYMERCEPMIGVLTKIEMRTIRPIVLPVDKPSQPPINHVAVTNIMDRVHAALRTVDCNIILDAAQSGTAQRVSDAIAAIEEFARERGIKLTEFK